MSKLNVNQKSKKYVNNVSKFGEHWANCIAEIELKIKEHEKEVEIWRKHLVAARKLAESGFPWPTANKQRNEAVTVSKDV